ncbi:cytochrome P450 [Gymnopilus junonius]|uniref:Cytochrome P450 n=1 Tax=Gymnopilus junonius TaxID=109634 RepID=A0A9P5N6R1_GYMJU|nr:cytochrome P450 [Gymnopilus junonius]
MSLQYYSWISSALFVVAATLSAICLIRKWFNSATYQLKHVPTVGGSSGVISSYFSALRFYFHGHKIIQEGYDKYHDSVFKVSTMSGWRVIICGRQMIEDVGRAPNKSMSFHSALTELLQAPYTLGLAGLTDPYHIPFTQASLTKRFASTHLDIKDEIIRPLIEDCLEKKKQYEEIDNKDPKDLVSWLVDVVQETKRNLDVEDLTRRILELNFIANGVTASILSDVLLNLATYPEYAAPLREEVERIIETEGWTKASIAKMRKVDNFVKETMHIGTGNGTGNRKLNSDFTFTNGISLPIGTNLSFATRPIHYDARHYENPTEFQGFRFAEMTNQEDYDPKLQAVSLTPEFAIFGAGRHACPGRFFATYLLKITLANIVLSYAVAHPEDHPHRHKQTWFKQSQSLTAPQNWSSRRGCTGCIGKDAHYEST